MTKSMAAPSKFRLLVLRRLTRKPPIELMRFATVAFELKKMNDFIQEATKFSDPVLEAFAYGDRLQGTGVRFFFGDENEAIEEFIDENKAEVDRYLEEINRHAIGGFTFSTGDRGLKPSPAIEELFRHLDENYFSVDEI
jgi:hypothetical protein